MATGQVCKSCELLNELGTGFCVGCGSQFDSFNDVPQVNEIRLDSMGLEVRPTVNFPLAISLAFKNAFRYSGRSTRAEFFWFWIFHVSSYAALLLWTPIALSPWVPYIFSGICLPPFIALTCRRLHDIGRTGWLHLPIWIPGVNIFFALWLSFQPSQPSNNKYGPR